MPCLATPAGSFLALSQVPLGRESVMTCFQAEATCWWRGPDTYRSSYRSMRSRTFGAISAYRLLGRSGERWCSIWYERLPVMRCMALLPLMLADPSIWRRYHSPRVSPSIEDLVKVWTPSGKWPHMMTEWVHRLRTRLAMALAPAVGRKDGPDSNGCTRWSL